MATSLGGGDGPPITPETGKGFTDSRKILSVFHGDGMVGAATFDPPTGTFGVLSQIPEHPNYPLVGGLINQEQPGIVVLSRRVDKKLAKVVVESMFLDETTFSTSVPTNLESSSGLSRNGRGGGDGNYGASSSRVASFCQPTTATSSSQESVSLKRPFGAACPRAPFVQKVQGSNNVVTIPHDNFLAENAMKVVLGIKEREIPAEAKSTARISVVAGEVNLEETVTLQAIAGLMKYMENQTLNVLPSCVDVESGMTKIKRIVLEDMVFVSEQTKKDLDIFKPVFKSYVGAKSAHKCEGSSLYRLLQDQCPSSLGRKSIRKVLDMPLRDTNLINYRLDLVEFFKDTSNEVLINAISKDSTGIRNIDAVLTRMRFGVPNPPDWGYYKHTVHSSLKMVSHILDNNHLGTISKELESFSLNEMKELVERISFTVDFEKTLVDSMFTAKEGVDPFLDEARVKAREIEGICGQARAEEYRYWANRGASNPSIGVGFWPGVGFLMELQVTQGDFLQSSLIISQDDTCEVIRHTPAAVFYRTQITKNLNEQFGDPRTFMLDRQAEIRIKLQLMVSNLAEQTQSLIKICAEILCFIAFANTAKFLGWTRPRFNKEGRILIKNGRHPISEQHVLRFFPNCYENQSCKIQVITGPNTSGKSVFMKQVGLIVYLAQVGSFVPADLADVSPVDNILTCIKNEDSVSSLISYFMSALNKVSIITMEATPNSLVIVDEFGKGTHPLNGTSLLAALINSFVKDPKQAPNVLVATHLRSALSFLKPSPTIDYLMFSAENVQGEFVNQFKLIKGKSESSLAFEVAKSSGIDPEIVSRSREISKKLTAREALTSKKFHEEQTMRWHKIWHDFLKVNMQSKKELDNFLNQVQEKGAKDAKE